MQTKIPATLREQQSRAGKTRLTPEQRAERTTKVPATLREQQSRAGKTGAANMTPEQRVARARKAWQGRLAKHMRACGLRVNKAGVLVPLRSRPE